MSNNGIVNFFPLDWRFELILKFCCM